MSGLKKDVKGGGKNIYLKIMNGKIVQTVTADIEGAVKRTNKMGAEVHEMLYTALEMKITNIAVITGKFGKELEVKGNADGQNFVIQTSASGGYAYGFFTRMPNLDFNKVTEIRTYMIEDKENKGKFNHVIVLYQQKEEGGKFEKIESAFSKDSEQQVPMMTKVPDPKDPKKDLLVNGKPVWSDTDRIEFFEAIIYGEGGINETLIQLFGSPEEVAQSQESGNEYKDDVDVDTEAEAEKESAGKKLTASTAKDAVKANAKEVKGKKK